MSNEELSPPDTKLLNKSHVTSDDEAASDEDKPETSPRSGLDVSPQVRPSTSANVVSTRGGRGKFRKRNSRNMPIEKSRIPSAYESCHTISSWLMLFNKAVDDAEFSKKACESLVKKLKDKRSDLELLIQAVASDGTNASPCIPIIRTLDGRLQVAGRKGFPHVTYVRIFRNAHAQKNELKNLPLCSCPYEYKQEANVCVNPWHYEKIVTSVHFETISRKTDDDGNPIQQDGFYSPTPPPIRNPCSSTSSIFPPPPYNAPFVTSLNQQAFLNTISGQQAMLPPTTPGLSVSSPLYVPSSTTMSQTTALSVASNGLNLQHSAFGPSSQSASSSTRVPGQPGQPGQPQQPTTLGQSSNPLGISSILGQTSNMKPAHSTLGLPSILQTSGEVQSDGSMPLSTQPMQVAKEKSSSTGLPAATSNFLNKTSGEVQKPQNALSICSILGQSAAEVQQTGPVSTSFPDQKSTDTQSLNVSTMLTRTPNNTQQSQMMAALLSQAQIGCPKSTSNGATSEISQQDILNSFPKSYTMVQPSNGNQSQSPVMQAGIGIQKPPNPPAKQFLINQSSIGFPLPHSTMQLLSPNNQQCGSNQPIPISTPSQFNDTSCTIQNTQATPMGCSPPMLRENNPPISISTPVTPFMQQTSNHAQKSNFRQSPLIDQNPIGINKPQVSQSQPPFYNSNSVDTPNTAGPMNFNSLMNPPVLPGQGNVHNQNGLRSCVNGFRQACPSSISSIQPNSNTCGNNGYGSPSGGLAVSTLGVRHHPAVESLPLSHNTKQMNTGNFSGFGSAATGLMQQTTNGRSHGTNVGIPYGSVMSPPTVGHSSSLKRTHSAIENNHLTPFKIPDHIQQQINFGLQQHHQKQQQLRLQQQQLQQQQQQLQPSQQQQLQQLRQQEQQRLHQHPKLQNERIPNFQHKTYEKLQEQIMDSQNTQNSSIQQQQPSESMLPNCSQLPPHSSPELVYNYILSIINALSGSKMAEQNVSSNRYNVPLTNMLAQSFSTPSRDSNTAAAFPPANKTNDKSPSESADIKNIKDVQKKTDYDVPCEKASRISFNSDVSIRQANSESADEKTSIEDIDVDVEALDIESLETPEADKSLHASSVFTNQNEKSEARSVVSLLPTYPSIMNKHMQPQGELYVSERDRMSACGVHESGNSTNEQYKDVPCYDSENDPMTELELFIIRRSIYNNLKTKVQPRPATAAPSLLQYRNNEQMAATTPELFDSRMSPNVLESSAVISCSPATTRASSRRTFVYSKRRRDSASYSPPPTFGNRNTGCPLMHNMHMPRCVHDEDPRSSSNSSTTSWCTSGSLNAPQTPIRKKTMQFSAEGRYFELDIDDFSSSDEDCEIDVDMSFPALQQSPFLKATNADVSNMLRDSVGNIRRLQLESIQSNQVRSVMPTPVFEPMDASLESVCSNENWAVFVYYEKTEIINEKMAIYNTMYIDGGFGRDPNRFSLGMELNPYRDFMTERVRRNILEGVRVSLKSNGDIWFRNYSKEPVFLNSPYLDQKINRSTTKVVHKIYPGGRLKVYDQTFCMRRLRNRRMRQLMFLDYKAAKNTPLNLRFAKKEEQLSQRYQESIEDLRRECVFSFSFVKGFGPGYPKRPAIHDCEAWIEVKLNKSFVYFDKLLQEKRWYDLPRF